MLKKVFLYFVMAIAALDANTQSIETAGKLFYYEKYKSAATELEKLIVLKKGDANTYYLLTLCYLMMGDKATALTTAKNGLAAANNNLLLQAALGHVYLAEGKKEEARQQFQSVINAAGPTERNSLLIAIGRAHGSVSLKNSDPDYGIQLLKEAAQKEPGNADIYIILGDCYRRKLDGGNAVASYEKASSLNPADARGPYKAGLVYKTQDNCEVLKRNFIKSTTIDANFMPAWRELYDAYSNIESICYNIADAKYYLDRYTATTEPGFPTEMLKLNFCYASKDYNCALKYAGLISEKYPKESEVEIPKWKAAIYRRTNDSVNALKNLEEYISKENNNDIAPYFFNMLGELYSKFPGQEQKAIDAYKKYQAVETNTISLIRSYNSCASLATRAKDFKEAAIWYKKVIESKNGSAAYDYFQCGYAWFMAQEYQSSADVFKTYESKFPADWRAPYWIARNYSAIDSLMKSAAAVPYFEKFLPLGEKDPQAKNSLVVAYKYLFIYQFNIKRDKIAAKAILDKLKLAAPADKAIPEFEKYLQ